MSRDMLAHILARHLPIPLLLCGGGELLRCKCGDAQLFADEDEWATHVTNVIYPKS